MTFAEKLREKKKSLKISSQDTYLRNVKRLRKVKGGLPIPVSDHKWLVSKALIEWFDKQPLSVRRHLSTAANVALIVYGKKSEEWKKRQSKSMEEFDEQRRKRVLSDKQKKLLPAKGFDSLVRVVSQMKKELKHVLASIDSLSDLLRVQDLVILSLYSELPLRLDFATLKIGKHKGNSIYKNGKKPRGWHILLADFKTAASLGEKTFRLKQRNQRLLNKFIPAVEKLTKHGMLLSNKKGEPMSKQVLSKTLMRLTKARIGKKFSVQLLRILYAMKNRDVIETAKQVSDKLLHSQEMSLQYAKKDPVKKV